MSLREEIKKRQLVSKLIGIPVLSFIITALQVSDHIQLLDGHFWRTLAITFVVTAVQWIGNYEIFLFVRKRFHGFTQTKKRIIYQTFLNLVFTFSIAVVGYFSCKLIPSESQVSFFTMLLLNIIPTIILILLYETIYIFSSWKEHIHQTESLMVENVKSQLDSLKSQLDPHFLFNSLNTLASLVGEQNQPAQTFLSQLSDVYRYVLVNREKNEVSVSEEIEFLNSYIYLNKIRFRENLQVEINITPEVYNRNIAPLSLQMLMENALKHNAALLEMPLRITISDKESGYLIIENNIQEKKIIEQSTKVGLQNIINRYRLLTDKEVFVLKTTEFFTVKIPLLS